MTVRERTAPKGRVPAPQNLQGFPAETTLRPPWVRVGNGRGKSPFITRPSTLGGLLGLPYKEFLTKGISSTGRSLTGKGQGCGGGTEGSPGRRGPDVWGVGGTPPPGKRRPLPVLDLVTAVKFLLICLIYFGVVSRHLHLCQGPKFKERYLVRSQTPRGRRRLPALRKREEGARGKEERGGRSRAGCPEGNPKGAPQHPSSGPLFRVSTGVPLVDKQGPLPA